MQALPTIIGAGPSGLLLGCLLQQQGVACQILERQTEVSSLTRALLIHAASLDILEKEIGGLPATVEAVTGEYTLKGRVVRGRHVLLRVDPSLELVGKLKELPGIDIKWNGYVLIAPSRRSIRREPSGLRRGP